MFVSAELIANASDVSQQLVIATDIQEGSLLPLDLNATNTIVSQVRSWSQVFETKVHLNRVYIIPCFVSTCCFENVFVLGIAIFLAHIHLCVSLDGRCSMFLKVVWKAEWKRKFQMRSDYAL